MDLIKKKKTLISLAIAVVGIVCTVSSYFILQKTSSCHYEQLANEIYPNCPYKAGTYQYNFLKITKSDEKAVKDDSKLYTSLCNFYNSSYVFGGARQVLNNEAVDPDGSKLKFVTHSTGTIEKDKLSDGTYIMNKSIFVTLYRNEILGDNYQALRYGAAGYLYVNEIYANALLTKYGISSYEELISNSNYCLVNAKIDGDQTVTLCINNIIKCDSCNEPIVRTKYTSNVCFIGLSTSVKEWAKVSLDVDLKANSYGITNTLVTSNRYGYNISNSSYEFYVQKNWKFESSEKIQNKYIDIVKNYSNDTLQIILNILVTILPSVLVIAVYMKFDDKYNSSLSFWLSLAIFIVSSITLTQLYLYSFSITSSLILMIVTCIFYRKEVAQNVNKCFSFAKRKDSK